MKTIARLALLAALAPFARADDVDALVDRLFDPDASVRAEARAALALQGERALPRVLAALEARMGSEARVVVYDLADFGEEGVWAKVALARVRASAGEKGDVAVRGTAAVVRAPDASHRAIKLALDELRRQHGVLIEIEARLVKGALPAGGMAKAEFDARCRDESLEVVAAPRLICRNGEKASIATLTQISYVADFEIKVGDVGAVADPVVDTARDGLSLELRPCATETGIALDVMAMLVKLERPLPTLPKPMPGWEGNVELQVPAGTSRSVRSVVSCEPGRVAIVPLGDGYALAVSARRSELAAPETKRPG